MTGPYTQRPMEPARAGTDFRDNRFDGLHAEAAAAVGYSANTHAERAELIGARFDVRSRPDGGTVVRLTIPTEPAAGGEESR